MYYTVSKHLSYWHSFNWNESQNSWVTIIIIITTTTITIIIIILQQELERPSVDKEKALEWLYSSGLQGETECLIIAAQDQVLNRCYQQKIIIYQPTDNKCRMCYKTEEHIKHIVAWCTFASTEYYIIR